MPTQRSGPSRRRFVAAAGAGLAGVGGCVAPFGGSLGSGDAVSALVAGSLQRTFGEGVRDATDRSLRVEAHGSVTAARLVATGKRDPDLVALADVRLFDSVLDAPWHATVAGNALALAYDAESRGGRRVADADRWFDPVLAGEASLGRTDPDLDPLGYRTCIMLDLAAEFYGEPGLRERVLAQRQVYPETSLLSRFETGSLDAAVVYRNMAVERGYEFRDLPAAVDLSDPARDGAYADATYAREDGETVEGRHIAYGLLARSTDDATRDVFDRVAAGRVLRDHGFVVPDRYPRYEGDVPRAFRG
ncbi:MAG: extracellular solute-binding protein [Haloarculaceae archaeon]